MFSIFTDFCSFLPPLALVCCVCIAFLHHVCIIICYIIYLHAPGVGLTIARCGVKILGLGIAIDSPDRILWNGFTPSSRRRPQIFPPASKTHVNIQPDRMETLPTTFSAEAYFQTQPPPSAIEQDVQSVREFLKQQKEHGRKVVLVTVCDPIAPPH